MKFKHLFLTALVVGALASCSKDDDGPKEPVYQQIETSFSISTTSNGGTISKAEGTVEDGKTETGADNERKIKTLTAVVFYDDGTFATSKTVTDPAQDQKDFSTSIEGIVVKVAATEAGQVSETKLKVFLLANVEVPQEALADYPTFIGSSFSEITKYSFDDVMAGDSYLPMSSKELTVTKLLAGTAYNNWVEGSNETPKYTSNEEGTKGKVLEDEDGEYVVGDKNYEPTARIPLTRYVARVQLESLAVDFGEYYENAKFTLTSVSVANASNSTLYTENNGSLQPDGLYKDGENDFYRGYPLNIDRADYYLARSQHNQDVFSKVYGTIANGVVSNGILMGKDGETTIPFKDKTLKGEGVHIMPQFYVFEFQSVEVTSDEPGETLPSSANQNINTMLIITGFWDNGPTKEERSFRIPIRHSGSDYLVKRNYIYKVNATLTGEGTPNPDKNMLNAFVSFNIEVEPWKVIIQNEEDVN